MTRLTAGVRLTALRRRVVIPEMYGYKNVKWVERIELVARPPTGFWEKLGYVGA